MSIHPITDEAKTSIVLFRSEYNQEFVVGGGILIGDGKQYWILTCAHVIEQMFKPAAREDAESQSGRDIANSLVEEGSDQEKAKQFQAEFPFISGRPKVNANVILKLPARGKDIAVLKVISSLPAEVCPAKIVANSDEFCEHRFWLFASPGKLDYGSVIKGRIQDSLPDCRVEFQVDAEGKSVSPGFSGCPVWDEEIGKFIGIVDSRIKPQAKKAEETVRVGFATLFNLFAEACTEGTEPELQSLFKYFDRISSKISSTTESDIDSTQSSQTIQQTHGTEPHTGVSSSTWFVPLSRARHSKPGQLLIASGVALLTTLTLGGLRSTGNLQDAELKNYDKMVQSRNFPEEAEKEDDRIRIIQITDAEIREYRDSDDKTFGPQASVPDSVYSDLLKKLQNYQPKAIGLDIYRDFEVDKTVTDLKEQLENNDNLFVICKHPNRNGSSGINKPPEEIPNERVAFSDFIRDEKDQVIRRHLLSFKWDSTSPGSETDCPTETALSLRLASHYLKEYDSKLGDPARLVSSLQKYILQKPAGGYQFYNPTGQQILLNYRAPYCQNEDKYQRNPSCVVEKIRLQDFLEGSDQEQAKIFQDKIVLIGRTDQDSQDADRSTPYGIEVPGVVLHAQMTSQLLSAIAGDATVAEMRQKVDIHRRVLFWVLPTTGEFLLILLCSGMGAVTLVGLSSIKSPNVAVWLVIHLTSAGFTLLAWSLIKEIGLRALQAYGLWLPIVPMVCALIGATLLSFCINIGFLLLDRSFSTKHRQ